MNSLALIQAGRESALFHLYGALLGLCHEIAGFYRLPQANASRAEVLTREVLESLPSLSWPRWWSWPVTRNLAGETAGGAFGVVPAATVPQKPKGDVTQPLIQAVNLDEEEAPQELSREELESWRQNLKGLAIRFREGLNEC
jgi:hypothetical protein